MTYNLAGTLNSLALLDETVGTEQHNTNLAGLKVHAHTLNTRGEPISILVAAFKMKKQYRDPYSTSSSAWTLVMPWTRAIPSLIDRIESVTALG